GKAWDAAGVRVGDILDIWERWYRRATAPLKKISPRAVDLPLIFGRRLADRPKARPDKAREFQRTVSWADPSLCRCVTAGDAKPALNQPLKACAARAGQ